MQDTRGRNLPEILIATRNPGKIREIQLALRSLPLKFRLLDEFADVSVVDEIGQTYQENAVLKAVGYARQTGVVALADDSGLEVAALGGRPGVFSARFGGEDLSDLQRTEKLLSELFLYSASERAGRFVCSMALAGWSTAEKTDSPRLLTATEGVCEGFIATRVRGENGFGYDPVFMPRGYGETFAELPNAIKSKISHRAQALAAMRVFLNSWLVQT
jgi:XTP/dITP diphosphohydrolase